MWSIHKSENITPPFDIIPVVYDPLKLTNSVSFYVLYIKSHELLVHQTNYGMLSTSTVPRVTRALAIAPEHR